MPGRFLRTIVGGRVAVTVRGQGWRMGALEMRAAPRRSMCGASRFRRRGDIFGGRRSLCSELAENPSLPFPTGTHSPALHDPALGAARSALGRRAAFQHRKPSWLIACGAALSVALATESTNLCAGSAWTVLFQELSELVARTHALDAAGSRWEGRSCRSTGSIARAISVYPQSWRRPRPHQSSRRTRLPPGRQSA